MVNAPERMFGHQLCKHLLSWKHTSCALESIGSSEAEDLQTWRHYIVELDGYFTPTAEILLLTVDQALIYTFQNERRAALSEHHAQYLHFSAPTSRCCGTPVPWNSNTRDLNPVDYKYEVLEKAFLLHLGPGTWHDSTDSTACTSSMVRGVQDLKGEVRKSSHWLFSHSSIFFLGSLPTESFNIPGILISVAFFSCMNVK